LQNLERETEQRTQVGYRAFHYFFTIS